MTPTARRATALLAMSSRGISKRHACGLVGVDPKSVRRERVLDHPEIRAQMTAYARALTIADDFARPARMA